MLVDARLPIETFEAQTKIKLLPLDGEDMDTLGGYVASLAGRIPNIGESFHNEDGLNFEVLEMDQKPRQTLTRSQSPRVRPRKPVIKPARAQVG